MKSIAHILSITLLLVTSINGFHLNINHKKVTPWNARIHQRTKTTIPLSTTQSSSVIMDKNPRKRHSSTTVLHFFNFGGGDDTKPKDGDELARIIVKNKTPVDEKYSSLEALCDYLLSWGELFGPDKGKRMGLTTPIVVIPSSGGDESEMDSNTVCRPIVKFQFSKVDTGYQSVKDEKKDDGKDDRNDNSSKKKKKEAKQGGVEIVLMATTNGGPSSLQLEVLARRWDIDENTMIKEMSEEVIVKKLKEAVAVWEKNGPLPVPK